MTKKFLFYLIFLLGLFLIQAAAVKVFGEWFYFLPSFALLFVIVFALKNSGTATLWMGFFVGFLLELFSGQFFGSQIFAMVLIGLLTNLATRKITTRELSPIAMIFLVAFATILFVFCVFGYSSFLAFFGLTAYFPLQELYSARIFWTILVNLLFFYPIRFVFDFLERSFGEQ